MEKGNIVIILSTGVKALITGVAGRRMYEVECLTTSKKITVTEAQIKLYKLEGAA